MNNDLNWSNRRHTHMTLAIFAIVVDSKNDSATEFYASYGFAPFPDTPSRLFLLTATARAAILASTR